MKSGMNQANVPESRHFMEILFLFLAISARFRPKDSFHAKGNLDWRKIPVKNQENSFVNVKLTKMPIPNLNEK